MIPLRSPRISFIKALYRRKDNGALNYNTIVHNYSGTQYNVSDEVFYEDGDGKRRKDIILAISASNDEIELNEAGWVSRKIIIGKIEDFKIDDDRDVLLANRYSKLMYGFFSMSKNGIEYIGISVVSNTEKNVFSTDTKTFSI